MADTAIKLVCFDLGGVLIRICRSWEEGCAAAGIEARVADLRRATAALRNELVREHQTGRIDGRTFAERMSALLERAYSPAEILSVHAAWLISEYADIGPVIDAIHRAGRATAALSNTNHEHFIRFAEFPSIMRLQRVLASHQLGLHKPDPAIFHAAERLLGYRGEEILYFDDLPDNVEAARTIGWRAVAIDPAGDTAQQISHALHQHQVC